MDFSDPAMDAERESFKVALYTAYALRLATQEPPHPASLAHLKTIAETASKEHQ